MKLPKNFHNSVIYAFRWERQQSSTSKIATKHQNEGFKSFFVNLCFWFLCSLYQKRILVINFPAKRFPNLFASHKHIKSLKNPFRIPYDYLIMPPFLFHRVSQHFPLFCLHFSSNFFCEALWWKESAENKRTRDCRNLHIFRIVESHMGCLLLTAYFCWLWFSVSKKVVMQQMEDCIRKKVRFIIATLILNYFASPSTNY